MKILKILKSILNIALCIVFVFAIFFTKQNTMSVKPNVTNNENIGVVAKSRMQFICKSSNLKLFANLSSGEFEVRDLNSDPVWRSNPNDLDLNKNLKEINKRRMRSQMLLKVYDKVNDEETKIVSQVACVLKGGLKGTKKDDGVLFDYYYPEMGITIPLNIILADGKLKVSVDIKNTVVKSNYVPVEISIAPFFGSGGSNENGYLFVPDGSGGLINFNNKKSSSHYKQNIYGRDLAYSNEFF